MCRRSSVKSSDRAGFTFRALTAVSVLHRRPSPSSLLLFDESTTLPQDSSACFIFNRLLIYIFFLMKCAVLRQIPKIKRRQRMKPEPSDSVLKVRRIIYAFFFLPPQMSINISRILSFKKPSKEIFPWQLRLETHMFYFLHK